MITIGLTTWSEHQSLLANHPQPLTLTEYAAFFPTVEVDTTFYALPQAQTIRNWQAAVPATFQFIFKFCSKDKYGSLHNMSAAPFS